jgi:hypothetical protein
VLLQFPAMQKPFSVTVSPQELFYLDKNSNRDFSPEGLVVYRPHSEEVRAVVMRRNGSGLRHSLVS